MEYKANLVYKIVFSLLSIFFIFGPFIPILNGELMTNKMWFNIIFICLSPIIIIMGIDELYQIFRIIIIEEKYIKIKIFGKIIKETKIETIKYNNKHYGIRKFTHMVGSVKSIIVNNKYFSCVTKMDNNYEDLKIS